MEFTTIITALLAAISYSVGGYLKQTDKLDVEKLLSTIILGAAIGFISLYIGLNYDAATQMLASAGIIANIEIWSKAIYRRVTAWLNTKKTSPG